MIGEANQNLYNILSSYQKIWTEVETLAKEAGTTNDAEDALVEHVKTLAEQLREMLPDQNGFWYVFLSDGLNYYLSDVDWRRFAQRLREEPYD